MKPSWNLTENSEGAALLAPLAWNTTLALSISLPILIFKERWGEELSQDTIIDIGGRAERLEWHMIKLKDITTKKSGGHFVQLIFIFIG